MIYVTSCRYCDIFPSINVKGTIKHLQLLPHELKEYEAQVEKVLKRYLKRLQWLLSGRDKIYDQSFGHFIHKLRFSDFFICTCSKLKIEFLGSRRVFGTILHKKVVILVDTSGSMEQYMNELKKELAALIWDQLYRLGARYCKLQKM